MVGQIDHQQFLVAGQILHRHLVAEADARARKPGPVQLAPQAEQRSAAGETDQDDLARLIANLIDAELTGQLPDRLFGEVPPGFVEADRHRAGRRGRLSFR